MTSDQIMARGTCKATHICKTKSGLIVPIESAVSKEAAKLFAPPKQEVVRGNLVVNSGRQIMAQTLGGLWESQGMVTPFINRITLGTGIKSGNPPHLGNTGLVQELKKVNGTIAGTFLLQGPTEVAPDITFPDRVAKAAGSGATVSIGGGGETLLTDTGASFLLDGVQPVDTVTINNDPVNPLTMGIKAVVSSTQLELHNPYGFSGNSLGYTVQTPGTQMLVSKLLTGNTFAQAEYGVAVMIHEAGLLFSNDTLFNRVIFAPNDDTSGILLQSDEANGVEISVRFEWLITF